MRMGHAWHTLFVQKLNSHSGKSSTPTLYQWPLLRGRCELQGMRIARQIRLSLVLYNTVCSLMYLLQPEHHLQESASSA